MPEQALPPNQAYYRACVGSWRAVMSLRITDSADLARSGMRWVDRVSVRIMAAWPRWLGTIALCTTVAFDAQGEVVHTTAVRWLGITIKRSVEIFALDPDGLSFTVRGGMSGAGTVTPSATSASYTLDWSGARFVQTTQREPNLVTLTQTGPGFGGTQALHRQP
ncbi:MAG: hypothetical protein Q8Q09_26305 [Deltaproteobacteria bacterium]|nr:hypothetical protein [Deltaproteobacteria bacterium]